MKNIVFNIYDINNKGGEERMCITLANLLTNKGYNIFIVSFFSHKEKSTFYRIEKNIKLIHLHGTFLERRITQFIPFINYADKKYESILKKLNIDIIIDVDTDRTPFTSPVAKRLQIKHIAWDHFCYSRFINRELSRIVLPYLKTEVDKLVVLTKEDKFKYHKDAKINHDKIVQIYNMSPIQENTYYEHNTKRVLAMGRLMYEKGFDLLIDAWNLVSKQGTDWSLRIVGDGILKQELLNKIKEYGLTNIEICAATNNPREEYLNADIFVLSSRYEGLGLVLLEAANLSLPLVSFDCDNGPREIIKPGINGFLAKPNNIEDLSDKLYEVMSNETLRREMSMNALNSVNQFRSDVILMKWINLIENI